jgi:hypothetical protein
MEDDQMEKMMVDAAASSVGDSAAALRREESHKTLPWIEKYRPSTLHDLIAHDEIITTRTSLLLFSSCYSIE